jgi:hypothetical protein
MCFLLYIKNGGMSLLIIRMHLIIVPYSRFSSYLANTSFFSAGKMIRDFCLILIAVSDSSIL